jgi:hypothetical protein
MTQTTASPSLSLETNLAALIEADLKHEAAFFGGTFWPTEPLDDGCREVLVTAATVGGAEFAEINYRLESGGRCLRHEYLWGKAAPEKEEAQEEAKQGEEG